jgi:indolepyruvate ferredoxin oxidoreductase alpha subunit
LSGSQALAQAAIEAGVSVVTSYAGSPVTTVVNEILRLTGPDQVHVHWASNEKTALEMAYGASLNGARALLCVKGVGLNIALDPLMALNLAGCNAGFVILVGDDPGAWGSQNEQDSRVFALAAELPLLEPSSVAGAWTAMGQAFALSESLGLPVLVRITRALALAQGEAKAGASQDQILQTRPALQDDGSKHSHKPWVVLPIDVVPNHRRLHERLDAIEAQFERSTLNSVQGNGPLGIVAAGIVYQKLLAALGGACPPQASILQLSTFHPFPRQRAVDWLSARDSVLVLEETAPWIERTLRATAQAAKLSLPIYGRDTGHISREGELFAPQIAQSLNELVPDLDLPTEGANSRPMPSRQPLCDNCPYLPVFDELVALMERHGGRNRFVVVGDPGCMVRAQAPPYCLLDVKNSLGSSIGQATGLALGLAEPPDRIEPSKRIIALSGDSSFMHSGLAGLIDLCRLPAARRQVLVIILDNGTTALSGGQPHPASRTDARGRPLQPVDLAALARDAGADFVQVTIVDKVDDGDQTAAGDGSAHDVLEAALSFDGSAVVIARGDCPRWPTPSQTRSTE